MSASRRRRLLPTRRRPYSEEGTASSALEKTKILCRRIASGSAGSRVLPTKTGSSGTLLSKHLFFFSSFSSKHRRQTVLNDS